MRRTRWSQIGLSAFVVSAVGACSLVFSPDQLSNGDDDTPCATDRDCASGRDCVADRCDPASQRCSHRLRAGEGCGQATDCTPRGTCDADGGCVPGEPDDARCDRGNVCEIGSCEPSGCRYLPVQDGGDGCDDGDPCDITTCSEGKCVGTRPADIELCNGSSDPCPAGTYRHTYKCDMFLCGQSCICNNAYLCAPACGDKFTACCDLASGSCDDACGGPTSNYEQEGPSKMIEGCTCVETPGVVCVRKKN